MPPPQTDDSSDDGSINDVPFDPIVQMLHEEVSSGRLQSDHIFYKIIHNALQFAQTISCPSSQFQWDKTVHSFCTTLKRTGGTKVMDLLRGKGFFGQKFGGTYNFNWDNWNIPLPSIEEETGYTSESGISKGLISAFLKHSASAGSPVQPLVDTPMVKIFGTVAGKDGMVIKPGFQFDRRTKTVIGGNSDLTFSDVQEKLGSSKSDLRDFFNVEADTWCLSTIDYTFTLGVGVDYVTKSLNGQDVFENVTSRILQMECCLSCMANVNDMIVPHDTTELCNTDVCLQCTNNKELCADCELLGHISWNSKFRACQKCLLDGITCVRNAVLGIVMDCEAKNFSCLQRLTALGDNNLTTGIADPPHRAKTLDQCAANWFVLIEGSRFNRVILRTLRNRNTTISTALKAAVTDQALIRKDRMDTQSVFDSTSELVRSALAQINICIHTLIPEPFRMSETNKVGVVVHPVSITVGNDGMLYVSDFAKGIVIRGRMHYPVEVEVIGSGFKNPVGISYAGGVAFLCEQDCNKIKYYDVKGDVIIQPKRLKKGELQSALDARNISSINKRVKDMQADLERWKKENCEKVDDGDWPTVTLDTDLEMPTAIFACYASEMKEWTLYVGSAKLFKIVISSTGAALVGNCENIPLQIESPYITGLHVHDKHLYIADSTTEGGIYMLHMETNDVLKIVSCNTPLLQSVYDITLTDQGNIFVTDVTKRKIIQVFKDRQNEWTTKVICGTDVAEPVSKDGCEATASFVQPTGLASECSTLYVCDTGIGSIKMITPLSPYIKYLHAVHDLMSMFGVHSKQQQSLNNCIQRLQEIVVYLEEALQKCAERYDKSVISLQGPHGVPSTKTVSTIKQMLDGLISVNDVITSLCPEYMENVKVKSFTTLVNEHLHGQMRQRYAMPTQLEFSQAFVPVIEECVKKVCESGFLYYSGRKSYYEVPNASMKFTEFPDIPKPRSQHMSVKDRAMIKDFIAEYGQPGRQTTVRGLSTCISQVLFLCQHMDKTHLVFNSST
jgi:hypothetical protein